MTQDYSELKSHIDQLWKIIEQQDAQIQELKKSNNSLSNERDDLQEKLRLVLSRETATPSTTYTLENQTARDHDNTDSTDTHEASSPGASNPVLPARSPYRSFNASDADIATFKDRKHQLSSTSLSVSPITTKTTPVSATSNMIDSTDDINAAAMSSQEPISPKIIQQDAKLFAQYQSAVLRRDMTNNIDTSSFNTPSGQWQYHPATASPIVLTPSKSSTLPCQSHEYRVAQRKQHNSMVFPSSTVIPIAGRKKKDDQAPPPTPPPHHYQQSRRQPTTNMTTSLRQQQQQKQKQHSDGGPRDYNMYSPTYTQPSSTMKLNSISDVTVKVIGSLLKSNEKGKDVVSFILSVGKHTDDRFEELWRVQKLYSDFLDLDLKLKAQLGGSKMNKMTRLPEKQLFTTRSPNKLDQRRVALEKYLHHVITLPMDNIADFCEFLSTNVVDHSSYMNQGNKEGYLTKRGKNFGGWKTRYFVLKKNRLDYYETKDGSKLGSILLDDAQIGRQTPPNNSGAPEDSTESSYRHAILILEYRKTSIGNYVRHILCASSDTDCDEWITALLQVIQTNTESSNNNETTHSTTPSSLARSNSTAIGTSKEKQRNKKQSSSDKQRKLFKGEIRTVSATPISHLRVDSSQAVDMEKLTLVPVNNDFVSSPSTINPTPSDSNDSGNGINTTATPSNSLPLSSPLSISSPDSPCTPRQPFHYNSFGTSPDKGNGMMGLNYQQQQYQHRPSLTKTECSLDDSMLSSHSRSNSPIPTALFDPRESDDSFTNGGGGGGNEQQQQQHQQEQQQQLDKKAKTKSANRMTLWGKKVFGNQQRTLSSPTSPNSSSIDGNSNIAAAIAPNFAGGNPTPPSSSSSASSSASQQQQQQHDRGSSKSLRHVLSRPSKHQQQQQQMEIGLTDENLLTTSPTNHGSGSKQFMPSLSKSSSPSSSSANNSKQVFGVPLEEAVRVSRVSDGYPLPAVVFRCIEYLDAKNAILEEGLYRLSGSNATLQKLKKKFNQDGDVPLLNAKEEYDVHVVAGLLKMWLRELPITVLTRELRPEFIQVIDLLERKDRVNELGRLVSELPLANYTLLRILTSHLIRVVKHCDTNLMTVRNIGIVFSPTLGIPGSIFNLFLSEFDYIFWTTKDGDAAPRRLEDEEEDDNDGGDSNDDDDDDDDDDGSMNDGKAVDDNDGSKDENEHAAKEMPLTTENQDDSLQHHQPSSSTTTTDPQSCNTELLAPISSVVVPRRVNKKLMTVQKNQGRNNRNSILYIDAAPNAVVDLEKHTTGGTNVTEDDEEIDELAMDVAVEDDMP
ncbi:hypothetical protein BCR42DRAFT_418379 [Absidia repens]|uniref:RhoGAP-domain-containing protein n=1 Tax=Absidia repens TaxID=90262 RepID=A0A1X2IBL5_9FUNG|nr:hypothetical protein BCR42DRAFT_418379 [Absidia repens]